MNPVLPLAFLGESLGVGELLLVLTVALLLFGSKNLPKVARSIGKAMEEFRRAAREVSSEILHGDEPTRKPTALPGVKREDPKSAASKDPQDGSSG
jgi:sec-independent protein translocase protein TatA